MIALLLVAAALAGPLPEPGFGVSSGLVVAPRTADRGSRSAIASTIYGSVGLAGFLRGEVHLGVTSLDGSDGVRAVEVHTRNLDLRLLGGVSLPLPFELPVGRLGVDGLVGPDLRLASTRTRVLGEDERRYAASARPSVAAGGWYEVWKLRGGLRIWGDLPRDGRFGMSLVLGLEL